MKNCKISAPGKLILLGEHIVVHGKQAILAAVDKRCFVEVSSRSDGMIEVISQDFKKETVVSYDEVFAALKTANKDLERFISTNDISQLIKITADFFAYPLIIIGEILSYLEIKPGVGFTVTIHSDIPTGCGMGSSAALAVATVSAISTFFGKELDKKLINQIAFRAEQKKHGRPSGGDNSASCYGGLLSYQKVQGVFDIQSLSFSLSDSIRQKFFIINTGTPKETTGEMIHVVTKRLENNRDETEKIFTDQERLAQTLIAALENGSEQEIAQTIRKGEQNLEKLGVVSDYTKEIIRDIEHSGGFAKVCGGGGKIKGTGILLCFHSDEKALSAVAKKHGLVHARVELGCPGVRSENYA